MSRIELINDIKYMFQMKNIYTLTGDYNGAEPYDNGIAEATAKGIRMRLLSRDEASRLRHFGALV